jgi:hypothetical protein
MASSIRFSLRKRIQTAVAAGVVTSPHCKQHAPVRLQTQNKRARLGSISGNWVGANTRRSEGIQVSALQRTKPCIRVKMEQGTYTSPFRVISREREKGGGGSEKHHAGGMETLIFCLKVPRQCPLVPLIGVRFYLKLLKLEGLR